VPTVFPHRRLAIAFSFVQSSLVSLGIVSVSFARLKQSHMRTLSLSLSHTHPRAFAFPRDQWITDPSRILDHASRWSPLSFHIPTNPTSALTSE